jgi:hypothetical protein
VFWKREIFLSKKNFGGKKINLAKKFFNLANTILPNNMGEISTENYVLSISQLKKGLKI